MASTVPHEIVDDDDNFDWEAAVREIDVACENTKLSTSRPAEPSHSLPKSKKRPGSSRQSTLDQFVCKADPPLVSEDHTDRNDEQDCTEGVQGACCIDVDAEAVKTWMYPVNVPLRDYQLSITKTALFSNTLVALPTGLGKTLIAAVVMYNYFRWFPEGKIIFAAPSRPLVVQQIEACHNIVGIPQEWTIDMTGQTSPVRRASLWKSKRVFFVTPQVLEKDIQSGTCLVKHLVCLVIDEAHRALGNYSYCVAVRELMAVPVKLRILALTATPGSKQQTIQHIIDNLHISTLEYRNESDHDVSPYVHNRKVELVEVAMGKDAEEINTLLLEVISPFVMKLCLMGVLQNRDFRTFSPCDLLNSRDKFRQAPPQELPQIKYGEVEGCFGVLITLYHIRKLLSSHGVRPACEMLEEKLQQGSFARLMSKNDAIWKVKSLMLRSLSHGAPNPKILKMLEILIDHFETNNPQKSRVIIFSNFRGSVRDIMDALAKTGDSVKATQFIGQNSGKVLKGQSQKVQQAVLDKFRAGGYNVIVATSIGEEGLDIMEVDLVICFDANISPLRMIQRMGRTGRKHDGRVVVLACQGTELKGYMRKQANSRAINKHMQNGGMHSFNFHPSTRMIPHTFKPEVQFVEISIKQYVPRGRRVKDDHPFQIPREKLNAEETELLARYFHSSAEILSRPSLIAFPHFQAFPSRVHEVMHSFRTRMLIDAMQCLQGISFATDTNTHFFKDEAYSDQCLAAEAVDQQDNHRNDLLSVDSSPKMQPQRNTLNSDVSPPGISRTKNHIMSNIRSQQAHVHSYLFGSDFVSVDVLGRVLILSVPLLPLKEVSHSKCASASSLVLLNSMKKDSFHFGTSPEKCKESSIQEKAVAELTSSTHTLSAKNRTLLLSRSSNSDSEQEKTPDVAERVPCSLNLRKMSPNEGCGANETPDVENKMPNLPAYECCNDLEDTELSPRLTNLIENGVVPESPIDDGGPNDEGRNEVFALGTVSPAKLVTELLVKSPGSEKNAEVTRGSNGSERGILGSPINEEIQTPLLKRNGYENVEGFVSPLIDEGIQTPLANLTNSSCSKDWRLSSAEKSQSVKQICKFRRLRKHGDSGKRYVLESMKENSVFPIANLVRSFSRTPSIPKKHAKGKRKSVDNVAAYIEEEAEVSSEAEASDDEEEDLDNNSYDDSFIDDRIHSTAASSQTGDSKVDMMAIYRRSLLSQSPIGRQPNYLTDISPDKANSLHSPQIESASQSAKKNPEPFSMNRDNFLETLPCMASGFCKENDRTMQRRKRKLSSCQVGSVPVLNLEQFSFWSGAADQESLVQNEEKIEANGNVFDDDQFYEGLDLDEVEAQATMLLGVKPDLSQKQTICPQLTPPNPDLMGSPSFDLGI